MVRLLLLVGIVALTQRVVLAQPGQTLAELRARHSRDELRRLLQQSKFGTDRLEVLLKMGFFYLGKTDNPDQDLDSALIWARQAQTLSQRLGSAKGLDESLLLMGEVYSKHQQNRLAQAMVNRLRDTTRIKLILAMGADKLDVMGRQKAGQDSAVWYFKQAQRQSEHLKIWEWKEESLYQIGGYYLLNKNVPLGREYFRQVIKAYQQEGNRAGEYRANKRLLRTLPNSEIISTETTNNIKRALFLARQLQDQNQQALMLFYLGSAYRDMGKLKEAKRVFLKAVTLQKAISSPDIWFAYYGLSVVCQYTGDMPQALYYALASLTSLKASDNRLKYSQNNPQIETVYLLLGDIYFNLGQYNHCVNILKESLTTSYQRGEVIYDGGTAKKLARALLKLGKPKEALSLLQNSLRSSSAFGYQDNSIIAESLGECYAALHHNQRAEAYYKKSVAFVKQGDLLDVLVAYTGISRFYTATNQFTKADPYLRQLLVAPQGKIPLAIQIEIHHMRFQVDSAAGHLLKAIRHYQLYKALSDSISNDHKNQQIAQLEVQNQTQERERHIQALTQQGIVQQSNLQKSRTIRNFSVASVILLTLLLGLGYNRYRMKQRSSQLLEEKQSVIDQKNQTLQQLLTERDWMLKEIHHRVKNNLQIITSLLHSQGAYLTDRTALAAIQESQNRVHAMALIHQKLYQSDQLASVPLAEYIYEIVDYLVDVFDQADCVDQQLQVVPIELDVTLAVPLGLIINEAVTNSLKYAFPDGKAGVIRIGFQQQQHEPHRYRLTISDNGVGLPPHFDPEQSCSLGLSLIRGLSKQIGATLLITGQQGVMIELIFTNVTMKRDLP